MTKNKEEAQLVKYIFGYPLVSSQRNEDKELLIETIMNWSIFLGLEINEKELTMIVLFIQNSYSNLTIGEIIMAIELSAKRALNCEVEVYNNFSPMYVGRILSAYLSYRKTNMADLLIRKKNYDAQQEDLKRKPSPEQQEQIIKEHLIDIYNQAINKEEISDPFNIAYDFLKKHKLLKVIKGDVDKSIEYGQKKYTFDKYDEKTRRLKIKLDEKREVEKNAKNFLVVKFLQKTNLEELLSKINSSMFVN